MESKHISGQAPPCQVTVSWLYPPVHGLDPLRQTQLRRQQAQGLYPSSSMHPRSNTKKMGPEFEYGLYLPTLTETVPRYSP